MALKLNIREAYREFYGRNTEQMPKLIADGRIPMNVSQFMQRRLDVRNSDDEVKSSYIDNYFDTGDAVVYHPDGQVKVVLDSQHLREINSDSNIRGGELILSTDIYDSLEGEEFKKGKLGKTESSLYLQDVKAHPVWKTLARDQALLNDYADYIFAEGKKRFDYDTMMGVYLDSAAGDNVKMRSWCVGRLECRSNAIGWYVLGNLSGRLLGIAPEALNTPATGSFKYSKAYTIADLQAADKTLRGLEGVLHPDVLKSIVDLRKKL